MPEERPCTLARRVENSESEWIYLFARPNVLGSSISPGQMARPTYYYMRSFQNEFSCTCGGKTATVITDNNFEIGTIEEPDLQVFAVAVVSIGIPALGSAASQVAITVATRVFGDPSATVGWLNPEEVAARARSLLGDPTVVSTEQEAAPTAICGERIQMVTGVLVNWPDEGEIVPPPTDTDEEAWRVYWGIANEGRQSKQLIARWLEQIRELLRSRDERDREEGRRQLTLLRHYLDRLLELWREIIEDLRNAQQQANAEDGGN